MKNILEMLEHSAERSPEKTVFADENKSVTYGEFLKTVQSIGSKIAAAGVYKAPVAVIAERSVENLAAMFGVLYAGCFYTVIDADMPAERIKAIFETLNPAAVLVTDACKSKICELDFGGTVMYYNEAAAL